jgi:hypothetical protein
VRVNASAAVTRQLVLCEETLSVDDEELRRLLGALARLDLRDADAVADQISALRLADGAIRLVPTEGEISALELALAALAGEERPLGPVLARLASICVEAGSPDEGRAA